MMARSAPKTFDRAVSLSADRDFLYSEIDERQETTFKPPKIDDKQVTGGASKTFARTSLFENALFNSADTDFKPPKINDKQVTGGASETFVTASTSENALSNLADAGFKPPKIDDKQVTGGASETFATASTSENALSNSAGTNFKPPTISDKEFECPALSKKPKIISSSDNSDLHSGDKDFVVKPVEEKRGIKRYKIRKGGNFLTYGSVIELLKSDEVFREEFIKELKHSEYSAYFWETVAVANSDLEVREFEFVLVESKQLSRLNPDYTPFIEKFLDKKDVVSFPNLGRDAILVVPLPMDKKSDFSHLAKFVRCAPDAQVHDLWKTAADEMKKELAKNERTPLWLSTAGMGVPWLHVRIDSRPKYYTYEPYKDYTPAESKGRKSSISRFLTQFRIGGGETVTANDKMIEN